MNKMMRENEIKMSDRMIPSHDLLLTPSSNMVICSFASGKNHERGLRLLKPTLEYYGEKFNIYMANSINKEPFFPNSGVIVIKRDPKEVKVLEEIWKYKRPKDCGWWDQQAILKLLGYDNFYYKIKSYNGPTEYTPLFGILNNKWNSRPFDQDTVEQPIIEHYCGYHWRTRLKKMSDGYKKFLINTRGNQ